MDSRVTDHAEILVEHCVDVQQDDEVLIVAPLEAEELAVALHDVIGERGAFPVRATDFMGGESRALRAFKQAMNPEEFDTPPQMLVSLAEHADAIIGINASTNTYETSDVPPDKTTAYRQLLKPVQENIMSSRWVGTQYPAAGNARDAEMSTDAYADFVYDAVTLDWEAQRQFQQNMVELLDSGTEVRIVSGETTDVTMSIEGMAAVNDDGKRNLPGGEVFTAPVVDSVEGEVLFDKPMMAQGREVQNVRLVFEQGEVVEYSAEQNEEVLTAELDTDPGARRLGELGIGMNRQIDRFTYNMLFDEKMGDTVHMALGRAYEQTVGENRERNDSAVHRDMIVDMSEDAYIAVDGEVVQRDGKFVFEEGFDSSSA